MPLSKNINTYTDVAEVLASILPHRRASYVVNDRGQARRFMQRCYAFRLLLQKQEAARSGTKGFQPPTPYDRMKLTLDEENPRKVWVDFDPAPVGKIVLEDGTSVAPKAPEQGVKLTLPKPAEVPEKDLNLLAALKDLGGLLGDED